MYNSTIRQKTAVCPLCPGTHKVPVVKGLCQRHYWEQNRMKSALKAQEKTLSDNTDLQTLVDDLDIIFSRLIRLKDADEHGIAECYTCGAKKHYKTLQCGHFVPRAHMYTRFSEDNCKPQCASCNEAKDGNLKAFSEHLERDRHGSVEILREQARIVKHYERDELKAMIGDCSRRVKLFLKSVYQ